MVLVPLLIVEKIPTAPPPLVEIAPLFSTVIFFAPLAEIAVALVVKSPPELMVPVSLELRVCCEVTNTPSAMVNDADQAEEETTNKVTAHRVTGNFCNKFDSFNNESITTLSL